MKRLICILLIIVSAWSNAIPFQFTESKEYESHDRNLHFTTTKPAKLIVNARWGFGNTKNHKVSSHFMYDTAIKYTVNGIPGNSHNDVIMPEKVIDCPVPGEHLFRITLIASGGKAYLYGPYIHVEVIE